MGKGLSEHSFTNESLICLGSWGLQSLSRMQRLAFSGGGSSCSQATPDQSATDSQCLAHSIPRSHIVCFCCAFSACRVILGGKKASFLCGWGGG